MQPTPITEFIASLRQLAQELYDAFKPYLDAANRYLVRRHHDKRRKAAHRLAQARRRVTPATYIPVRRHPSVTLRHKR